MLDRTDRGDARRRGTDLVRVQRTRAVSRGGPKQPSIYLSELGPRRVVTQLKWFISTIIVAVSGLAIIGVVIFSSMHGGSGSKSIIQQMRRDAIASMKPRAVNTASSLKQTSAGYKTGRLTVSAKGTATRSLIYDRVEQRRGSHEFITTKPYVKIAATLATERPGKRAGIPPFKSIDLFGAERPVARKGQASAELTSDPRVSLHLTEVPGGFLPNEDNQELTDTEAEKFVAEADAVYSESEASLTEGAPSSEDEDPFALTAGKNTTILYKKSDEGDSDDAYDYRSFVARGGESLESLIRGMSVDSVQSKLIAKEIAKATKSRTLRARDELRLALTPSSVEEGSLDVAKVSVFRRRAALVTLARSSEGEYIPSSNPVRREADLDDKAGDRASVYLSVYTAAKAQGLSDEFITKFLKIYAYDVDFKQRVRAGDNFELFYNLEQDGDGTEKPGELLYAIMNIGGEPHGYFRFRTPDGSVDYYDSKGSNSKKFLMRKPLRSARLTSGFGYRVHPLLKTRKLHTGVDWAAPVGTPLMAAGSGVIEVAGRRGGYGNFVRIRHANGYKTGYGHMHRFAKGIVRGAKVQQGQIIGFVGNTGLSTGPHVHYEVLKNNRFMNPLSLKIPRARQLKGRLLTNFRREKARIEDLVHRAPVKTRVVSVEN